jgi:hypothetical protein
VWGRAPSECGRRYPGRGFCRRGYPAGGPRRKGSSGCGRRRFRPPSGKRDGGASRHDDCIPGSCSGSGRGCRCGRRRPGCRGDDATRATRTGTGSGASSHERAANVEPGLPSRATMGKLRVTCAGEGSPYPLVSGGERRVGWVLPQTSGTRLGAPTPLEARRPGYRALHPTAAARRRLSLMDGAGCCWPVPLSRSRRRRPISVDQTGRSPLSARGSERPPTRRAPAAGSPLRPPNARP